MTNNVTDVNTAFRSDDSFKVVNDTLRFYFVLVLLVIANACVSVFGIAANLLNIAVFLRQGLKSDSTSASLLGLAVTDLLCVFSLLWLSIIQAVDLANPPNLGFIPWDVLYITGGAPNLMIAQITRMATAYVSFERCVCVVFPFKVKAWFTSRRTCIAYTSIFVVCGVDYSPIFFVHRLDYKTIPGTNTTVIGLVSLPDWRTWMNVMVNINNIIFNIGSVATVFICTIVTIFHLNLSKTWRESLTPGSSSKTKKLTLKRSKSEKIKGASVEEKVKSQNQNPKLSDSKKKKEKKVVVMIILISIVFLISYMPNFIYLILNMWDPAIRAKGLYHNFAIIFFSFIFVMESVNCSINIFIYYRNSSRYRQELRLLFKLKEEK